MIERLYVAKAIIYRIFSLLITLTGVYLFTHSFSVATGATALIEFLKTVWYYSYDKTWSRLGYLSLSFEEETNKIQGIRGGYPLIPISEKIKGFVSLMRPLTMLGGFIAGFCLVALAAQFYNVAFSLSLAFLVGFVFALMHAGSQTINQTIKEEIKIDRINKPYRPIVKGVISREKGIFFGIALFVVSILLALLANPSFVLWILIIALFGIFYSSPPLRIKKFLGLNNAWQGVARGFLPVVAVFSIFSSSPPPFAVALGTVIAIWICGGQASKDIDDIEGDKHFGIRNFFTVLGEKKGLEVMLCLMLSSFVVLNFLTWEGLLPVKMILLNALILPSVGIVHFLNKKVSITENNTGWVLFYSTLGLWFIFPVVSFFLHTPG